MANGEFPPPPAPAAIGLRRNKRKMVLEEEKENEEEESLATPIGDVVRVSGIGESTRNHFSGFEAGGICYQLEDTVLMSPKEYNMKPSVAIIKDITTTKDGEIIVTGQRLYRPEAVEKGNSENWKPCKARELFYSFEKKEFPADSIMHKCQVHFILPNKNIPSSIKHPGFIVRKVYDANSKKLSELLDTCYDGLSQYEINMLVQKTMARIASGIISE